MLVSASTATTFQILGVEGAFKMFADAGFDAVDFGFDVFMPIWNVRKGDRTSPFFLPQEELNAFFRPYKEAADKYGVRIHQAHAPFPAYIHDDPETTAISQESVKKCFPLCKMMSCRYLVVHPCFGNYNERMEYDDEWDMNIRFYTSLIEEAKKYDVIICLENMFTARRGKIYEAICSDPNEAAAYIDELNSIAGEKRFGFCFDTGHALLLGRDQYLTLKQLGDRVDVLHVHDNDGWDDQHVSPFMGRLDWDRLIMGLRAIGYKGVMNLEVGNLCNWYPKELLGDAYRLAAACAKYLGARTEEN